MKTLPTSPQHTALVTEACRIIEQAERAPSLQQLADRVGISSFHFHRLFKQVTGLTPKQYALAQREQRLRAALHGGSNVTDAIIDAGYQSNSRFYEKAHETLGMNASHYRAGGTQTDIRFAIGECAGLDSAAQSQQGICAILLGDDPQLYCVTWVISGPSQRRSALKR
jgi:AraC family transcriptional regulator of adaptative response/methylated-DNA-[protein]-cysteine methyltransferase